MTAPVACDIYLARLSALGADAYVWASDWEVARAGRYRSADDAARSLLGAVLIRAVAALHLAVAPADVVVDRMCARCGAAHGRPTVIGGPSLSLSHSGDLVIVAATTADRSVGVDVEVVTDSDLSDIVEASFAPADRIGLATSHDVLVCWTRKEAYLKATGEGLSAPLADVRVSPAHLPATLIERVGDPGELCAMADLGPWPGHVGTVAVLGAASIEVVEHSALDLLPV